jgi:curli biogenesis system outer membrane secretion channel CsgG
MMHRIDPVTGLFRTIVTSALLLMLAACASESHQALTPQTLPVQSAAFSGAKAALAVGKFYNRSTYMQGIFSSGVDQMGNQAKTILKTHLQQSKRFNVVDRENMEEIAQESQYRNKAQNIIGAQIVLTGEVTEFGRKVTGDAQLFGILGYGKRQTAYAKVALNVVDVRTSQIIHSVQGAGEYELSNREIIGFGSTAGYDSTLNGKVLNLAIMEAVQSLINDLEAGKWSP